MFSPNVLRGRDRKVKCWSSWKWKKEFTTNRVHHPVEGGASHTHTHTIVQWSGVIQRKSLKNINILSANISQLNNTKWNFLQGVNTFFYALQSKTVCGQVADCACAAICVLCGLCEIVRPSKGGVGLLLFPLRLPAVGDLFRSKVQRNA